MADVTGPRRGAQHHVAGTKRLIGLLERARHDLQDPTHALAGMTTAEEVLKKLGRRQAERRFGVDLLQQALQEPRFGVAASCRGRLQDLLCPVEIVAHDVTPSLASARSRWAGGATFVMGGTASPSRLPCTTRRGRPFCHGESMGSPSLRYAAPDVYR